MWLSLSRAADVAPSLDIVPRRLDGVVETGTDGARLDYRYRKLRRGGWPARPGTCARIFEPGDALLFDELYLHQTASDPSMP